ncbi:hypothetical protein PBV87_08095 [Niameybacter massiliensis]|uniref:Uncharacterized protein n=1 Tax=Holtiella tumoricola TaxID=3018743 RepID=A0AA42DLZ4_9FIRM|nr:hypothetical protein [Holtiella tumoricola]MDA3731436.1 hypothetical protein [Holtiella tumoricola]
MKRSDIIKNFIEFYTKTDRSENIFNEKYKRKVGIGYETFVAYTNDIDVQNQLKDKYKDNSIIDMLEVYQSHLEKAKKGDVNSAKFCMDFFKSDMFADSKSEVDKILETLKG